MKGSNGNGVGREGGRKVGDGLMNWKGPGEFLGSGKKNSKNKWGPCCNYGKITKKLESGRFKTGGKVRKPTKARRNGALA